MTIHVVLGATAPLLAKQLGLSVREVKHWQLDADAITRLAVRGMLSEAERHRARRRLVKQIASSRSGAQP
jgi:hypothetical protein